MKSLLTESTSWAIRVTSRHESKKLIAIDTQRMPWEERFNERIGRALFRKELYTDPETSALIRLVRYPAGVINPKHTHPCGHGMYVLEGKLVTHAGTFVRGRSSGFRR